MKRALLTLTLAIGLLTPLGAQAATKHPVRWICPPTGATSCVGTVTIKHVPLSGPATPTTYRSATSTKVDCFFLYPTASPAPRRNAPERSTRFLRRLVRSFALPFTRSCRLVVPAYAQVTSQYLATSRVTAADRAGVEVAYQSVLRAWHTYLASTNSSRGVVLVGFSQGTGMLSQLLRREIAPNANQLKRVVLSELIGGGLTVSSPRSVNDGLAGQPLCAHVGSIHCVIAYDAFTAVPSARAIVGRPGAVWSYLSGWTAAQGSQTVCVNPVYGGEASGPLIPYIGENPYSTYANRFRAACERQGSLTWLDIRQIDVPAGGAKRNELPSLPPGSDQFLAGLHGESWSLTLGNLVTMTQAAVVKWDLRP